MRTREEIENNRNEIAAHEAGVANKAAALTGLTLEVLLDIRDLLAYPPIEITHKRVDCTCGKTNSLCPVHSII